MTKHNAGNERIKRKYFAYVKEAKRYSESSVDAAEGRGVHHPRRPPGAQD